MDRKNYLRSKMAIPQIFHKLLPRKSISAIINNAALNEAVCFVAPYGYGKTLAVVSWLRDYGQDAVWLTLDAADDSEPIFWAALSAAMLRATGWEGDANDVLADSKYIEDPQKFFWGTVLSAEKSVCAKILVLDDFQFVRDHMLLRSIKNMIYELLGRWRVIIMSRTELPAVFTELILKEHVCLITPKELSYSPEEMAEFFSMNDCTASPENVLRIRRETDGWAAALNVVLTISRGGSVVYGEAARTYVMGFFETEIWGDLEENTKDFLLKTSILDKLTPAVCRAVTDIRATLPLLRWLFANGLFISKLDEKDAYCFHRVFQDFLRDKLSASGIDERELYKKLAWWLFDNNEKERSFPCFFQAGDLYGISQVFKTSDLLNMDMESYLELISCITTLDIADLKPYPVIVARMALIEFLKGNVSKMQALYHTFEEWNDLNVLSLSPEDYAEYLWESGWLCYLNPDEPTRANKKHLAFGNYRYYVPHLKKVHLARTALLIFPSFFRGIRDYGDDGLFDTEGILERIERGEKYIIDEEEGLWKTYLILAEYKYEIEDFARAEEIVRQVMPLAEDRGYTELYFCCTYLLVKLMRATHNSKEIDAVTARLETMIRKNGHTFLLPNFHAFELRNRLADGQAGLTEVFEKENKDYVYKPYFYLHYRHFTFVRGLLSLENYSRALLILGNLELLCQRYKRPTDLIEVNILNSIALYGLGYEDDACGHFKKALAAAERYGYIRIFSDDAKDIWPILELVRKQVTGKHIQNIIISCKKTLTCSGHKSFMKKYAHISLTKTELEILKALQSGMSYAEIGQDNDIRMSTVKSHLHSIYSKLEVNNKTAAVIAAQNLGIL